ncbi:hypothetical protein G4G28_04460 [Massilia sp. Dwa41.01b]|uniref:hypothetical protein n=1 Tax=unclassified Massilia TaxID=2609279 RepID=UPI001600BA0C|nr:MULTISPECIES: hypothetical protein [unclassified Massilia]QNA87904.1 hypothetical protein G4G28_04460 [Massilia sp. Dwa41.01b]QNA98807.1 hypothetical protein G4G31_08180 [Massilia sp. Se16.2.3]
MQDTHRASLSLKRPLLLCALAAACALPLLPVQAGEGIHVSRSLQASDGGAPYAVVRGKDDVVAGERADSARIKELRRSIKGDFLWFRDGGKEYVVQDPATMGRVLAAWAPLEAIGARMGGQGAEMGRHGAAMGSIGAKMALAAITFDGDKMEALGKEMEAAGKPMEAAGKKMEELGKEMEREQDKAERAMRVEIRDALSKGTARPLPLRS